MRKGNNGLVEFCMAKTRILRKFRHLRTNIRTDNVMRVLIYFGDMKPLGDAVMRNAAVLQVRRRYPEAKLYILLSNDGSDSIKELFSKHSWIDEIVYHPPVLPKWNRREWALFMRKLIDLEFQFCVIDSKYFEGPISARILRACGVRELIGRTPTVSDDLFLTKRLSFNQPHWIDAVMQYSRALGLENWRDISIKLPYLPEELPYDQISRPAVVVHVGGNHIWNRCWPLERYRQICLKLCMNLNASIYLSGSASERSSNEWIRKSVLDVYPSARIFNIEGIKLNRFANYLSSADLFIGNDSGPMHFAVAVGTPVIAIFGPSDPAIWGPDKVDSKHQCVLAELPCQPCEKYTQLTREGCCRQADEQYLCLSQVSVEHVWLAVLRSLTRTSSESPQVTVNL